MATESDLRDLLRGPEPEGRSTIDLDAVLRRTRARRRPRIVAAGTIGAFALVGVLTPVVVFSLPPAQQSSLVVAEDADNGSGGESAPQAYDSSLRGSYDLCGERLVTPAALGWTLTVSDPSESTVDPDAPVLSVSLENSGVSPESGIADIVSFAFTQDGVVVARGFPVDPLGTQVDLATGESFVWDTALTIESCGPTGMLSGGSYDVRAVVEFLDPDLGAAEPIRGATTTIELR